MAKEMTYTNRICINGEKICLEDLPAKDQERIANELIYRPLTTLCNVEVRQTA